MKKMFKIFILIIFMFTSINEAISYFNTEDNFINKFMTNKYTINLNPNGGYFNQESLIVRNNKVILATPLRSGYTFIGFSDSIDGDVLYSTNIDNINKINNINLYAKWTINQYYVDVNPIVDGVQNNSGYSGYTFDVYVNGFLVADDVSDWANNLNYGDSVRVVTNEKTGHTSNFDKTIIVGTGNNEINPTWTRNVYQAHFYYNNTSGVSTFWTATNNLYGDYVMTPAVTNVNQFGYEDNFYYFSGFSPWSSWYQQEFAIGFTVNINERNCRATFGTLSNTNANYQQTKFHNAGYNYCNVNPSNTKEVVCSGTYSNVLSAYNSAWNILPYSGNGFSRYKDMSCDSGWSTYATR